MNPNLTAISRSPGRITVGIHRPGVFVTPTIVLSAREAREFAFHLGRICDAMQVADENLTVLAAGQKEKESNGSGI